MTIRPPNISGIVPALVVGGGVAVAAPLITGKDIKNGPVTTDDLKNSGVASGDVKDGTVGTKDTSRAAIDRPALLTQYSPRLGDASSALTDVTNTIDAAKPGSARRRAT